MGGGVAFDTGHVSVDNVDVQTVDHFVEVLLSEGAVDRRQIYAVGESGGGVMAALYAMLRPRRIAAFGTYGADASQLVWSCDGLPPPAAIVYRACDAVTPCADVEQWLGARQDAHAPTFALRLGAGKATEPSCVLSEHRCRVKKGTANHNRWPKERETEMLETMSRYSLAGPPDGGF
jgi:poly(3-hydroxybutyrate) depolymerase